MVSDYMYVSVSTRISLMFFSVFVSQLMTAQTVMVSHLIVVVKIIYFARTRVVTLENASLIVQVYRSFITQCEINFAHYLSRYVLAMYFSSPL